MLTLTAWDFSLQDVRTLPTLVRDKAYIRLSTHIATWKPKKGSAKTTAPLKGDCMGFHVSLGERIPLFQLPSKPLPVAE